MTRPVKAESFPSRRHSWRFKDK
ncbi:hypothetical protein CCACVL1_27906 [Corchorus capsularis]|uniref:Uncharacterized protein n=1 Tax=Corchorus capsularis TaxID=210143 RepID=A0A1R3G8B4_COCAP|nr:hypothetical protein CCACVL1_27906 [Corchorus capsularis]